MILQYKGINNNWCYEEAERIICANVNVENETKDYRKGGARYEIQQKELDKSRGLNQNIIYNLRLRYVQEMHRAVDEVIRRETGTSTEIVYLIGDTKFDDLDSVAVVILEGKNVNITYVFDSTHSSDCIAYILNSNGGTVQKIK